MEERVRHAEQMIALDLLSVHYVNIDYHREHRAPAAAGQRLIVDDQEWDDPTWQAASADSLDFGLELGLSGDRVFSVTWDPPGEYEGLTIREGPLAAALAPDGDFAIWDVGARSRWRLLLGRSVTAVTLNYEPWNADRPDDDLRWCPSVTVSLGGETVFLLLGDAWPGPDLSPSADNVAVVFDREELPSWRPGPTSPAQLPRL